MIDRKINRTLNPKLNKIAGSTHKGQEERFYLLRIDFTDKGLAISTDGNGFNPYEILGFLELIKSNILKSLVQQNG